MAYIYHKLQDCPGNKVLRAEGRSALSGRWGKAMWSVVSVSLILTVLIDTLTAFIAGMVIAAANYDPVVMAAAIFITAAVSAGIGVISSSYNGVGLADIFLKFHGSAEYVPGITDTIKKSLKLYGVMALGGILAALIIIGKLFLLIVPGILAMFDYSMLAFCLADDPSLGPCEALKRSRAIVKGHRWQLFRMGVFFIVLCFLSIFTLFIAMLWIWPYMFSTYAAFYRAIKPASGEKGEENNGLPPVSGQGAFNSQTNIVIITIIMLLMIIGNFSKTYTEITSEKLKQESKNGTVQNTGNTPAQQVKKSPAQQVSK